MTHTEWLHKNARITLIDPASATEFLCDLEPVSVPLTPPRRHFCTLECILKLERQREETNWAVCAGAGRSLEAGFGLADWLSHGPASLARGLTLEKAALPLSQQPRIEPLSPPGYPHSVWEGSGKKITRKEMFLVVLSLHPEKKGKAGRGMKRPSLLFFKPRV